MTQVNDNAKAAAEAEWLWPTLCIGSLWAFGLLLSWVWLFTWIGLAAAAVVVPIMVVRTRQKGWLAAIWAGGYALCAFAMAFWILVLAFFRVY